MANAESSSSQSNTRKQRKRERLQCLYQPEVGTDDAALIEYLKSNPDSRPAKELLLESGHQVQGVGMLLMLKESGRLSEEQYRRRSLLLISQLEGYTAYARRVLGLEAPPVVHHQQVYVMGGAVPESMIASVPSAATPQALTTASPASMAIARSNGKESESVEGTEAASISTIPVATNGFNPFKKGQRSQVFGDVFEGLNDSNDEDA